MKIKRLNLRKFNGDGYLIPIEEFLDVPFDIKRVYILTKLNRNSKRGYHAHKKLVQVLYCLAGSFKIVLDDGFERKEMVISALDKPVVLSPLVWHELKQFTPDTVILVVCSDIYKEEDYIRDYNSFLKLVKKK